MIVGTHHWPAQERVIYGKPAVDALAEELKRTGAQRVFVTTTRSITNGALVARIVAALGQRFCGKFDTIAAPSPRESVVAGAALIREETASYRAIAELGDVRIAVVKRTIKENLRRTPTAAFVFGPHLANAATPGPVGIRE